MRQRAFQRFSTVLLCLLPVLVWANDPALFKGLKARSIGPANMSGRIGSIDAVASDPNIIYVGAATGGLWKSTDGGTTFAPVMDELPISSIGAVAINQTNPDIVWVGTGEAAPRNSVGVGRGVYRSMDGGKTWNLVGLEKSEKISRILLDPNDPDIAYVGALGPTWGDSDVRGLYKTTDGGKTWNRILYVNEKTGVSDVIMDPVNPNKIWVGMWEHRRWPWFFHSGGPGSGLYMTVDGGLNWKKFGVKEGIPKGDLGRIGLGISVSDPNVVYALVEAEKSVLLRSADGGYRWDTVNTSDDVGDRPFYYHRLWVNPVNENIVYILHSSMMISEDGGRNFRNLTTFNQAHSDFHAMWIHPQGEMMVVGNDGGVVISYNRGKSWRFVENLPLGQFYHVSYDMSMPYHVYGGLQDNGSWVGPAYTLKENVIYDYAWIAVGGGDGFDTEPDPEVPGAGYGMSQGGNLYYFDTNTGLSRYIQPTESDVDHRFHWNAGFAVDPFHPATIYLGSQFVHKSTDKGQSWEIISPDLTTNDPAKQKQDESGGLTLDVTNAENHCTILCIAPSPIQEGIIWVSTDDGNVQLTRDGGKTWTPVSGDLTNGKKGRVPQATWSPQVDASKFDPATAYVVFEDHRRSNWTPYIYVTRDYGKTWKSLVTPEIDGFVHCIEEDVVDKDLLFLGTEFGLFVSFNGGAKWMKWTEGFPTVPVHDLAIHPREHDLIIGTHGRSIYIIDDIAPLREIDEAVLDSPLHLFHLPEAVQINSGRMSSHMSPGDTPFAGENKQGGASITYYLIPKEKDGKEEKAPEPQPMAVRGGGRFRGGPATESKVKIAIMEGKQIITEIDGTEEKGVNRVYWNFRERAPQQTGTSSWYRLMGPAVLPGTYTVKIRYYEQEASQPLTVKSDPRFAMDMETMKSNHRLAKSAMGLNTALTSVRNRISETQQTLKTLMDAAKEDTSKSVKALMKTAKDLDDRLKAFSERITPTPKKQGINDRSKGLSSKVNSAVRGMASAGVYPITQAAQVRYERAKTELSAFVEEFNRFFETEINDFRKAMLESGFSILKVQKTIKIE